MATICAAIQPKYEGTIQRQLASTVPGDGVELYAIDRRTGVVSALAGRVSA